MRMLNHQNKIINSLKILNRLKVISPKTKIVNNLNKLTNPNNLNKRTNRLPPPEISNPNLLSNPNSLNKRNHHSKLTNPNNLNRLTNRLPLPEISNRILPVLLAHPNRHGSRLSLALCRISLENLCALLLRPHLVMELHTRQAEEQVTQQIATPAKTQTQANLSILIMTLILRTLEWTQNNFTT